MVTPTLEEDLEERHASELVAIVRDGSPAADAELAAMWAEVLARRDPIEILGNAILWCSLREISGAVAEGVRAMLERIEPKHRTEMTALLVTIERYARGTTSLEDVWDATQAAKSHVVDTVTEAVVEAGESAGGNMGGFDDEALDSAGSALTTVIAVEGEAMRDAIVEIVRRWIPLPTAAAFRAAHAARYRRVNT